LLPPRHAGKNSDEERKADNHGNGDKAQAGLAQRARLARYGEHQRHGGEHAKRVAHPPRHPVGGEVRRPNHPDRQHSSHRQACACQTKERREQEKQHNIAGRIECRGIAHELSQRGTTNRRLYR